MTRNERPPFPLPLLRFWFVRILPIWCLNALMIFLVQFAVGGIVRDNQSVQALLRIMETLPSVVKTALGEDMLQAGNMSGLVAIGYQHPLVLILYMLFAVGIPTGLLAGEVQKGTMELILSRPAAKTHVYVCAAVLTIAGMFALVLVMFLGTVFAVNAFGFAERIPLYSFLRAAINGGLLASAVGGIALLAAAAFRRRGTAVGVSAAFLVLNYFVSLIAVWWPPMRFLRPVTLFHYANIPRTLAGSAWPVRDMSVLAAILLVAAVAGGYIWRRRDLPL